MPAFIRSSGVPGTLPGYLPNGRRERHPGGQPSAQRLLVRNTALGLALLLASGQAALRLLLTLLEQIGRTAPTLLLMALVLGVSQVVQQLWPLLDKPLEQIHLAGETTHLDSQQMQQQLAPLLAEGGFFSLDLNAVHQALESQPLIASASVRRQWPGQLDVQFKMHRPLFRWGEQGLLTEGGRLLSSGGEYYRRLPQLVGPLGSEAQMVQQYLLLDQMLRPIGLNVSRLERRPRGSEFLTAISQTGENRIEFALGRGDTLEKMQHFVRLARLPELDINELLRVDLRHKNGLAIARKPIEQENEP